MSIRHIKRRTVAAMHSTVRVELRIPSGMTRSQVIRALRQVVRSGFRPFVGGEGEGE